MLEISEGAFTLAITESLNLGKSEARNDIVTALNNDAVLQTNISTELLEYIVNIVEAE